MPVFMKYINLLLLIVLLTSSSCRAQKESVSEQLHDNIYLINNQYFYGELVKTYLIELEDKILLFDIPTYTKDVETFILSFKKPVFAIISHGSCGIKDGTKWQRKINLKVYAHKGDENHPWLRMKPDIFFTDPPFFDNNIEIISTKGHSAGSVCVLDKNTKSLFTGDTFQGDENGNVVDFTNNTNEDYENLTDRINSCKSLLKYDFENVYPFHYNIIKSKGKIALKEYLKDK